jgi:hypothetical protein
MAKCSSCQAEVVFIPSSTSGKKMILDAKPKKGVVLMSLHEPADGEPKLINGYVAAPGMESARAIVLSVYTDHHATCPHAALWGSGA